MVLIQNRKLVNKKVKTIYNCDGSFNIVKILDDIFYNKCESIQKTISNSIKQHIGQYTYIIENGQKVYFGGDLQGEYTYSNSTKNLTVSSKLAKGRAVVALPEIIKNLQNRSWEPNRKLKHKIDAKYGFYRYRTVFSFEYNGKEQIYEGTVLIRNDRNGRKYLYDILEIKKIGSNLPLVVSNS